jgi:GntR family transcriptional regulator
MEAGGGAVGIELGEFAPKYMRIAMELRRDIRRGVYRPGERMPAELALVDRFRVSLPTVRQALTVLRSEGLLESRQGVGTFVREDRQAERRTRRTHGPAETDGQLPTSHVRLELSFAGRTAVPSHIAESMGVAEGTEVVTRRGVLYDTDTGRPDEIHSSYIDVAIAGGSYLEQAEATPKAVHLCIEELSGKTYSYARDRWVARRAYSEEVQTLDLPPGSNVVHLIHRAEAADGTVLEVSESISPADGTTFIDEYPFAFRPDTPGTERG